MCGRYTLTASSQAALADRFGAGPLPAESLSRWNVAPTETMAVVIGPNPNADDPEEARKPRRVAAARWGLLPRYARDLSARPQPINARSEDVREKAMFSSVLSKPTGRCLVVADGFYEWLRAEDRRKITPQPFRYTVDGGAPFAFAGLTVTNYIGGERIRTALLLTCSPNELCARVHNRMPVILEGPEEEAAWIDPSLDPAAAVELCRPLDASRMEAAPVSSRVNRAGTGDEGPHLLEPDPPTEPEASEQGSLF